MEESFEAMKARYIKEMERMRPPAPLSPSEEKPAERPVSERISPPEGDRTDPPVPEKNAEDTGVGYLTVWAVTAQGAMPVPDAEVILSRIVGGENTLQGFGLTDSSGRTRTFALPTLSAGQSQSPSASAPYTAYDLLVRAEGFSVARYLGIPVFDGIASVQKAVLVPDAGGETAVQEFGKEAVE